MKQEYDVIVVYDGYDPDLDLKLRDVADKERGEDIGSGLGFGQRDHQFRFCSRKQASKFATRVRSWKAIQEASGNVSMHAVECYDCDKLQSECVCEDN